MKAAVCYELGKPLVIEEIEIDPPKQGEVKVRLGATAICHSDVFIVNGGWGGETPVIAGHEAAGVVEEVGPGVTLHKPGDRVLATLLRSCGRCRNCAIGVTYICEGDFALAREGRLHRKQGDPIRMGANVAAFAEYVVIHESQLAPIPDDLPLDQASLISCGVITGSGAVMNTANVEPDSSVVIIGAGGVGLNSVQAAEIVGAYPIIAIDLIDHKLEAAKTFGATHTVNGKEEDSVEAVRELTQGGANYVFVTVGNTTAIEQGLEMVRSGGTEVIVGVPEDQATITIRPRTMNARGAGGPKNILGSYMGSTRLPVDIPKLINLHRQGRPKLEELITERYPIEQINEAMAITERGDALRNVIMF